MCARESSMEFILCVDEDRGPEKISGIKKKNRMNTDTQFVV